MKQKLNVPFWAALGGLLLSTTATFCQGTAFTYQGRLAASGSPVSGLYDFTNALYNAASGGTQFGPTITSGNSYATMGSTPFITRLSNALCDGNPNALLIVTHNITPPGYASNLTTHASSVMYNGTNWTIYHDDQGGIVGQAFNVLIIQP